jgi:hypothetical protein
MTHEERLSALLREEAETVLPAGDGLARIQARLAARRRSRWLLLPGAAALTAGAVAAAFVLSGGGSGTTLTQTPTTHGPTPATSPTAVGGGLDHAFENPALWPFTSAQQIAGWRSTYPYANDKSALVQHYLQDVLSVSGFTLSKPCESCDVVDIAVAGHKVGQAALERFLLDGTQVWTISTIGETDLKLLAPGAGEAVSSPTTVTGRITGVDEHVNLALVTQAGATVATGGAQAGSAVPWTAQLSWTDNGWSHGAVVARTFSAKDGTLSRLTALPVMRGSAPAFPAAIWPFASQAQVQAWQRDPSGRPWAADPHEVAVRFLRDYLRLTDVTVAAGCPTCVDLALRGTNGRPLGTIHLVHQAEAAYSVTGVTPGSDLSVASPAAGQRVTSPVALRGTITGVDESIAVSLLSQAGAVLGRTTTAAGTGPWSASLRWAGPAWYTGALVLTTDSARDGSTSRLVVVRVVNGT